MDSVVNKSKFKGFIFLFLVSLLMAGSAAAWLYFTTDLTPKPPMRARQVFLWHNNQNNVQTIIVTKHNFYRG